MGLPFLLLAALEVEENDTLLPQGTVTFSRSGSSKPSANSLLSITEEAATSSGVDPLIDGEAEEGEKERKWTDKKKGHPAQSCDCSAHKWTGEGSKYSETWSTFPFPWGSLPNLRIAVYYPLSPHSLQTENKD